MKFGKLSNNLSVKTEEKQKFECSESFLKDKKIVRK